MGDKVDLVLIDGNPGDLKYLENLLNKYHICVKSFTDPIIGLDEIQILKPSIVVVAYHMKKLNGEKFIVKLSEMKLFQHSKVFLLTSLDMDAAKTRCLSTLGFDRLLSKPVDGEIFIQALESVLGELKIKENLI